MLKKRKPNTAKKKINKDVLILLSSLGALSIAAFLVLIAPLLGAAFAVACTVLIVSLSEVKRRRHWELSTFFKITQIEKHQDFSTQEVRRQQSDIGVLKESISHISQEVSNLGSQIEDAKPRVDNVFNMDTIPLSIRPYHEKSPSAQNQGANDDPFAEHSSLSDMVVQELTHKAVREKRIDVFLQPIVSLPQRHIVAYEMFGRLRAKAGLYVSAQRYLKFAKTENLLSEIDTLLLQQCLETLSTHKRKILHKDTDKTLFFINLSPMSLQKGAYMRLLLDFASKNRELTSHLVFEMSQESFETMPQGSHKICQALAKAHCQFSLDNMHSAPRNIQHYIDSNIRFLKFSAQAITEATGTQNGYMQFWRNKQKLRANGINIVADRIETEGHLREILELDLAYGQGYLFGKPDLQGVYGPFTFSKKFSRHQGVKEQFA